MGNVPIEVLKLWENEAVSSSFNLILPITATQGAAVGSIFLPANGFNNRTVVGIALMVADSVGKAAAKTPTNGALLTLAQTDFMHLSFVDEMGKNILENIPLSELLPKTGKMYVPLYLPNFNPSKSSVRWCATLGNTADVNFSLILYTI